MAPRGRQRREKEVSVENNEPIWDMLWRTVNSPLSLGSATFFMLALCIGMGQALYESKQIIHALKDQLQTTKVDLYRAEVRQQRIAELEHRTQNFRFIEDMHEALLKQDSSKAGADGTALDLAGWEDYLASSTSMAWKSAPGGGEEADYHIKCDNPADVILSRRDVWGRRTDGTSYPRLTDQAYEQGLAALRECGFVYIEDLIPQDKVQRLYEAFARFRNSSEAPSFRFHDSRLPR